MRKSGPSGGKQEGKGKETEVKLQQEKVLKL